MIKRSFQLAAMAIATLTVVAVLFSFTNTPEVESFEEMLPTEWTFSSSLPAEIAAAKASIPCNPRLVIGNDTGLKNCVRAASEPGCSLDAVATVLGTCATGEDSVNVVLRKDCAGVVTDIVTIDLCGCDLQSWTCL